MYLEVAMSSSRHASTIADSISYAWPGACQGCAFIAVAVTVLGLCVPEDERSAGWHEKTPWKEGLAKTVEWYRVHGLSGYWDDDAVEKSLDAHPTYFASQNALNMPKPGLGV